MSTIVSSLNEIDTEPKKNNAPGVFEKWFPICFFNPFQNGRFAKTYIQPFCSCCLHLFMILQKKDSGEILQKKDSGEILKHSF